MSKTKFRKIMPIIVTALVAVLLAVPLCRE